MGATLFSKKLLNRLPALRKRWSKFACALEPETSIFRHFGDRRWAPRYRPLLREVDFIPFDVDSSSQLQLPGPQFTLRESPIDSGWRHSTNTLAHACKSSACSLVLVGGLWKQNHMVSHSVWRLNFSVEQNLTPASEGTEHFDE